jgi:hypothetical protein
MAVLSGESPYYRNDDTRLLITFITIVKNVKVEKAPRAVLLGIRYRRISL